MKHIKIIQEILHEIEKKFTISTQLIKYYRDNFSVAYFTLKETPDWKFGVWLNDNEIDIFGEHVDLIDKFKPSRTYLSFKTVDEFNEVIQIHKQPKLYFVDSLTDGNAIVDYKECYYGEEMYPVGYQVVREWNPETNLWNKFSRNKDITQEEFVNTHYDKFFEEKRKDKLIDEEDRKKAFTYFKELINVSEKIIAVGIVDGNKKGIISYPRYNIRVVVSHTTSDEEVSKLFDEINERTIEANEQLNRYDHNFVFYGIFDQLIDIKVCDYKYLTNNKPLLR